MKSRYIIFKTMVGFYFVTECEFFNFTSDNLFYFSWFYKFCLDLLNNFWRIMLWGSFKCITIRIRMSAFLLGTASVFLTVFETGTFFGFCFLLCKLMLVWFFTSKFLIFGSKNLLKREKVHFIILMIDSKQGFHSKV